MHLINVAAQVTAIKSCRVEMVMRASRENSGRVYNILILWFPIFLHIISFSCKVGLYSTLYFLFEVKKILITKN